MDLNTEDSVYKLALNMLQGVGSASVRSLIESCGSEKNVFTNTDELIAIGAISDKIAQKIKNSSVLQQAADQIEICLKHNINVIYFTENNYPRKLARCEGAPTLLYKLGDVNFDTSHTVAIVGTRSCDSDGKRNINTLVEQLKEHNINVIIISGLAAGADTFAHQAAIKNQLPTAAILGHGLNMVYPAENRKLAGEIVHTGGALLTEYYYGQPVAKTNFPRRNRIVAGLCDALIVAQSKIKGGALITVDEALKFKREVFAFPGRISDKLYAGCNYLIANNKATLLSSADDLEKMMNWTSKKKHSEIQTSLNLTPLSREEVIIIDILHQHGSINIDTMSSLSGIPIFKLSSLLLNMEFRDLVQALPGKRYEAL